VQLRLRFDTLDGTSNAYEGVYLDDLRIEVTCPIPAPCTSDDDCPSDNPCIATACSDIGCVQTDTCEEPDPCQAPGAAADCCTSDSDCDDGDALTLDVCDGASCTNTPNPDGCLDSAACDDGEPCTVDSCDSATYTCVHSGLIAEGCCLPGRTPLADFDRESLDGIYVTDNLETGLFWRPDPTRATSGEFALYCGDPVSQSYEHDRRIKSSATTRPFTVPTGGRTSISFDLYKATRTERSWDVFQVFVLRGGALFPMWSTRELADGTTGGSWQHFEVPLEANAGQEIQVRFVFDSVDAPQGAFEGTYIDTLSVVTHCQ
jgi:hypothetical protein